LTDLLGKKNQLIGIEAIGKVSAPNMLNPTVSSQVQLYSTFCGKKKLANQDNKGFGKGTKFINFFIDT
jgi:hypothetical protein